METLRGNKGKEGKGTRKEGKKQRENKIVTMSKPKMESVSRRNESPRKMNR